MTELQCPSMNYWSFVRWWVSWEKEKVNLAYSSIQLFFFCACWGWSVIHGSYDYGDFFPLQHMISGHGFVVTLWPITWICLIKRLKWPILTNKVRNYNLKYFKNTNKNWGHRSLSQTFSQMSLQVPRLYGRTVLGRVFLDGGWSQSCIHCDWAWLMETYMQYYDCNTIAIN